MPGPDPSDEEPIGVPFPGVTSCETGLPNWVGHLVTEYSFSPLLVYNYAVSGSTVTNVRMQIESYFYPKVGSKPRPVPWTADNSLFVTWVGINDLAYAGQIQPSILELFLGEERLYEAGARNFLFIDVPPIDRAPACTQLTMFDVEDGDREATIRRAADRFANWNIALAKRVRDFSSSHSPPNGKSHEKSDEPDAATVLLYSAHKTLTTILDDPIRHDFPPTDVSKMEASIWADHLHPTSRVHDFWARDLGAFLSSVKPYEKHLGDIEANPGHGVSTVRKGH